MALIFSVSAFFACTDLNTNFNNSKKGNLVSLSGNISYFCLVHKKQKRRTIIFYKSYFEEFFVELRDKVKAKVVWTFDLIEELEKFRRPISNILRIQKDFMK